MMTMEQTERPHDLALGEYDRFRDWARSRPSFTWCQHQGTHTGCCTPVIEGTFRMRRQVWDLPRIIEQWRALGRPDAPRRQSPQHGLLPPRTGTLGPARARDPWGGGGR